MFSREELNLIRNADFFRQKKIITAKIYAELNNLRPLIQEELMEHFPDADKAIFLSGKINRGENLDGLPWINMDCPGWFKQQHVFAVRYLFWWSKHFSITLHIGGDFLEYLTTGCLQNVQRENNMPNPFFCIATTPWNYHYAAENYLPLSEVTTELISAQLKKGFIKISICYPLNEMEKIHANGLLAFKYLIRIIKN
jgi:hypothetical protein